MARSAKRKKNVHAHSITVKSLKKLEGILVFVGKPLFRSIWSLFYFLALILEIIGKSIRITFNSFIQDFLYNYSVLFKKIKFPKVRYHKRKFVTSFAYHKIIYRSTKLQFSSLIQKLKSILPKVKLPKIRFGLRITYLIIILLLFSFVSGIFLFWLYIIKDLPEPSELITRKQDVSTKIYDRNGVLLYKIFKDENRTPIPFSKIPLSVKLATIAVEDAEFYSHPGFSLKGILRAIVRNFRRGELTGGSTITQQLVKNVFFSPEKKLTRKLKEIVLAVKVELNFSKDQILEMYLNEVSYGGTAYGIQEASQFYFGKNTEELSLAEAAFLAGLPKSPTKYSPYGANPSLSINRQKEVLNLMEVNGFITEEQKSQAEEINLNFMSSKTDIKAPHFVMYVRQYLVDKYGEELVEKGGLEVVTTLDYSIQELAEDAVKKEVDKLSRLNVRNGATVIVSVPTGEILAMVGSKDYFDNEDDGQVNVTIQPRQPGSSIKVVNYAYALSNDYTPSSFITDSPVTFQVPGQPPYSPRNYDNEYRGRISLRSALAESRNIPAVKVLASYGVSKMIEQGKKMGITTWDDPSRFGLSLTLGGGEVKLIDLAKVYTTIANYGKKPEIYPVSKVTNYLGVILEESPCTDSGNFLNDTNRFCKKEEVLDAKVAFMLIDILHDNSARSPSFGTQSQLVIEGHPEVAVKTGTSNDLKDNLSVGFNQKYLVAVWVGNNDNSPMARIASGVTGAAPIFNRIMSTLIAKEISQEWQVPQGLAKVPICTLTGSLPCQGCPTRLELFTEEKKPKQACNPESIKNIVESRQRQQREGQILESAASTIETLTF